MVKGEKEGVEWMVDLPTLVMTNIVDVNNTDHTDHSDHSDHGSHGLYGSYKLYDCTTHPDRTAHMDHTVRTDHTVHHHHHGSYLRIIQFTLLLPLGSHNHTVHITTSSTSIDLLMFVDFFSI